MKTELLFKYRGLDKYLIKNLRQSALYFSSPLSFNDPFDCNLEISGKPNKEVLLKDYMKTHEGDAQTPQMVEYLDQIFDSEVLLNEAHKRLSQAFYGFVGLAKVCCLSKSVSNLLMWSHYSNCHKGICLGYDSSILKDTLGELYPVRYSKAIPPINFYSSETNDSVEAAINFLTTKSIDWKYEQEVRFFRYESGLVKIPKKALKRVVFGARCSKEDKIMIMTIIAKLKYTNVDFRQTFIDTKKYQLLAQKIVLHNGEIYRETENDIYKKL